MARRIIRRIRLGLDDRPSDAVDQERPPDELSCDDVRVAREELSR